MNKYDARTCIVGANRRVDNGLIDQRNTEFTMLVSTPTAAANPVPSRGTVLILGANGRLGRAATAAFSAAGWRLLTQARRALAENRSGLQPILCEASDTEAVLQACADGVDVIVHGWNPPYTDWEKQVPLLTESALQIARRTGALLMLPGNVYNFGRTLPAVLDEDTPQQPNTSKAAIRIALEQRLQAATAEGVRSVVIRAGDFIGGAGPGTWFDLVIASKLGRGRFIYPGPMQLAHAWAWLPDLARVFVAVAERRAGLAPFEVLHYAGLTLTGRELHAACERAIGRPLQVKQLPWWLLRLAAPVVPMLRALVEMRYLWQRPHRLQQGRLEQLLGNVPRAGVDDAVRDALDQISVGTSRPGNPQTRAPSAPGVHA